MRRRSALLAVLLVVASGACTSGPDKPGPNDGSKLDFTSRATITIDDSGVNPALTNGRVGDALTVVNRGTKDHGLTSKSVDTGTLHPGESTVVFLTEVGAIDLYDRSDPSHTAHIEVGPAPESQ